jgi:hypothetical protein
MLTTLDAECWISCIRIAGYLEYSVFGALCAVSVCQDTDCWKTYDTEGRLTGVLSTWDTMLGYRSSGCFGY